MFFSSWLQQTSTDCRNILATNWECCLLAGGQRQNHFGETSIRRNESPRPPSSAILNLQPTHSMAWHASSLTFFFYLTPAARCNFSLLYTVFRRMCSSTDVFLPAMCSTHFTQESSLPHTHTHTRLSLWPMQSSSSPEVTHQPVPGARRSTTHFSGAGAD